MSAHTDRILFVDDDADTRGAMTGLLRREGFEVFAVGTCEAALRSAQQAPIDLLITDLRLPDADGFAVLKGVRAVRPVQAILVSGAEVRESDVGPGRFSRRLVKPILFADLLTTINELLDPRRLTTRLASIRETVKLLSDEELCNLSGVLRRRASDLKEEVLVLQEMLGQNLRANPPA
jgi:DNA-binding response OmpR family regulator